MAVAKQTSDERALRRLIKRATRHRNWDLVRMLFQDLGELLAEQDNTNGERTPA